MAHARNNDDISRIISSFTDGNIEADECFCLILSLDGYESTRTGFLSKIDDLKITKPVKYKLLSDTYVSYFKKSPSDVFTDPIGFSVENGYLTTDFGFELDMEMALSLSLSSQPSVENFSSTQQGINNPTPSYAATLKPKTSLHSEEKDLSVLQKHANWTRVDNIKDQHQIVAKEISPPPGFHIGSGARNGSASGKRKKKKGRHPQGVPNSLSNRPVIYWIRRDLRVYDNPALVYATQQNAPVIFTFIWCEDEEDPDDVVAAGGATKLWLHHALEALNESLVNRYGNGLIYRKTKSSQNELKHILADTGARTLVMNDVYEPFLKSRDDQLCRILEQQGVACKRFHSYLLHEPGSIATESMGMRGVGSVTHFMECARQSSKEPIGQPVDAPGRAPKMQNIPSSCRLDDLNLARMPRCKDGSVIDWATPIRKSWNFGEDGAWEALNLFLEEGIRRYEKESGRADNLNTCRISPYLHFGQISPRAVLTEARQMKSPKFQRKLSWRDLSYWLLSLWPELPSKPIREHYREQRWSKNKAHLKAWQKGCTGYPLVDAAMRQLWLTGWTNNYMRHVVASFLISYLHLHWIEGYRWFQDTLLDADVAINAMMWQNGGMSGLDQWNFVMHPVDAAMTCDPDGAFVRQWCPELAQLPNDFIHQPWKCPPSIAKRCRVELGVVYPHRIITNLEDARDQSLADVVSIRKKHPEYVDRRSGNDLVPMPNGLLLPVITRMEFKYKTSNPESKDNPHTAVLRGYRSRKRDEAIAYANERDFLASTMNEFVQRKERLEKAHKLQVY